MQQLYGHLDEESYRIVASAKVEHYLSTEKPEYQLDQDENAIWSLMLASGYLKAEQVEYRGLLREPWYHLKITNLETTAMFTNLFKSWFNQSRTNYNQFIKALLQNDIDAMNYYMNQISMATFSYFDVDGVEGGKSEPERFYHGFVLGLIPTLNAISEIEYFPSSRYFSASCILTFRIYSLVDIPVSASRKSSVCQLPII